MQTKLLTMVIIVAWVASFVNATIISVPLPELVGENQAPFSTDFSFDSDTSFTQINDIKVQIIGTFIPGQAHGDGMWTPVDQVSPLYPEIEVYFPLDVGSCYTFLHPYENPYDISNSLELKYGATWDFLFDGIAQGNITLGHGAGLLGMIVEFGPTIDITEAYFVIDGVIPEPATLLLLLGGVPVMKKLKM